MHGDVGLVRRRPTRRSRSRPSTGRWSSASPSSTPPTSTALGTNEQLVGRAIAGRRDEVVLATKFGNVVPGGRLPRRSTAGPSTCARRSTRRSRASASTTSTSTTSTAWTRPCRSRRRSARWPSSSRRGRCATSGSRRPRRRRSGARTPSTRSRRSRRSTRCGRATPRASVLDTCRELGIGFVAYSPLGRGFLTGRFRSADELDGGRLPQHDCRASTARTSSGTSRSSRRVEELAAAKGVTPAQLALAWVLSRGADVVPIPGTKRRSYLEENARGARGRARPRRSWRCSTRRSRAARPPATATRTCRRSTRRRARYGESRDHLQPPPGQAPQSRPVPRDGRARARAAPARRAGVRPVARSDARRADGDEGDDRHRLRPRRSACAWRAPASAVSPMRRSSCGSARGSTRRRTRAPTRSCARRTSQDDKLDLSAWARDAIALELPEKILCKAECAGLCAVCGRDLNVEPHAHDETESTRAGPRSSRSATSPRS